MCKCKERAPPNVAIPAAVLVAFLRKMASVYSWFVDAEDRVDMFTAAAAYIEQSEARRLAADTK